MAGQWRAKWWHVETYRALLSLIPTVVVSSLMSGDIVLKTLAGWDAFAIAFLGLSWLALHNRSPQELRLVVERSRRRKRLGEQMGLSPKDLTESASLMAMAATLWVLPQADEKPFSQEVVIGVCLVGVVTSWIVTHLGYLSIYIEEYVHAGGLDFPGDQEPDIGDFAYFAFGIGTSFGATDVTVTRRGIRRHVLRHGILSFVLNTAVVAVMLTFVTSYLSSR
ncbi:DUF1345 domain-containing protein [Kineosporia babensis]|uniref:DUF1345 domain-containing protein n=1 Tax=Kineosporia babensis TaxID=499548 RepID=A0A9X1NND7_9ACTN|nr:DUF1345 domain-containing protein [Kineosporia babensis]